jgi:hypothetical protein
MRVPLRLPAASKDISGALVMLDTISSVSEIQIADVICPVTNLGQYIQNVDLHDPEDVAKLNELATKIDGMDPLECTLMMGAIDAESINGLDDILQIADHLNDYDLFKDVTSDRELGVYLVEHDLLDVPFPEAVRPYLDYAAIGAKYYSDQGGAYTINGYTRRKETFSNLESALLTLDLRSCNGAKNYALALPASPFDIDAAKRALEIRELCEAEVSGIKSSLPHLADAIPTGCVTVEDANELALAVAEITEMDDELMKYLSVLEAEQPDTFPETLRLALNLDDYERITEGPYEYGRSVLRRIGADDEVIDTIDGYMDFERFGADAMEQDGVRQTEFGLVRRLSEPFPELTREQTMM